jgi:hypothetical protein
MSMAMASGSAISKARDVMGSPRVSISETRADVQKNLRLKARTAWRGGALLTTMEAEH